MFVRSRFCRDEWLLSCFDREARLCGLFLWCDDRRFAVAPPRRVRRSITSQIIQDAPALFSAFLYEVHAREEPQQEAGLACGGEADAFACFMLMNF